MYRFVTWWLNRQNTKLIVKKAKNPFFLGGVNKLGKHAAAWHLADKLRNSRGHWSDFLYSSTISNCIDTLNWDPTHPPCAYDHTHYLYNYSSSAFALLCQQKLWQSAKRWAGRGEEGRGGKCGSLKHDHIPNYAMYLSLALDIPRHSSIHRANCPLATNEIQLTIGP